MAITNLVTVAGLPPKNNQTTGAIRGAEMSNVGLPEDVVDAMYERAISHPSRGRKKNGEPTSRNKTGLSGVFRCGKYGKWRSRIRVNGETINLRNHEGKTYFHSAEEAHQAYVLAAVKFGVL